MLPLLGFPALRHLPVGDSALGQRVPPPPRATSEVWLPPSRPSSPSSRRRSAGASLGFALQGVLLDRKRCPFRGPCPPDVTRVALTVPEGTVASRAAYRASCLRRVRAVARRPKSPGRRYLPGLFPFRAFSPRVRAIAFSHDAGPLVLGRGDVPTRMDLKASRNAWIGWPVSELPALLGFRTL